MGTTLVDRLCSDHTKLWADSENLLSVTQTLDEDNKTRMYAVIFRAITGAQDNDYGKTVNKLRELAFDTYGCLDFIAVTEGNQEIAISYWKDEESIQQWKNDPVHVAAQRLGRAKWYESYSIDVVELKRRHRFPEE